VVVVECLAIVRDQALRLLTVGLVCRHGLARIVSPW
jgi:hypothetical protein